MKVCKEIMDGSKIWTSPSKVSELTIKLNWRIQIKYINMLNITISTHDSHRGSCTKESTESYLSCPSKVLPNFFNLPMTAHL